MFAGFAVAVSAVSAIVQDDLSNYPSVEAPEDKSLYLKYKPYLEAGGGCVPSSPVKSESSETSDGIKSPASSNGESSVSSCSSEGQVYARGQLYAPSLFAIMYAWYMPNDQQTSSEGSDKDTYKWESAIVWLSGNDTAATYKGIAVSSRSGYSIRSPDADDVKWEGTRPYIEYRAMGLHRELGFGTGKGGEQPLIAWEELSKEAQRALEDLDLGDGGAPFTNTNYQDNLEKAKIC